MLSPEARWFGWQIAELDPATVYPMCNLGSGTAEFREQIQPWIDRYLFAPARKREQAVVHVDIQDAPGVDLVGDLEDEAFLSKLVGMNFRSVFCSNLLEHVADPKRMAARILQIVPHGGCLFVSVPRRFPYHADPIDTMFRPHPAELAALFPGTRIERQAVVNGGTMLHYVAQRVRRPRMLWRSIVRRVSSIWPSLLSLSRTNQASAICQHEPCSPPAPHGPDTREPSSHESSLKTYIIWTFRSFQITCIILRKEAWPKVLPDL